MTTKIAVILLITLQSHFAFSEEKIPLLAPNEVKFSTPLRFFTESINEGESKREALNIQLGVEKLFYSNSLKNTVSIETNFAFPLYHDVNAIDWENLNAEKVISPMQLPSDMQLGVNLKLFF